MILSITFDLLILGLTGSASIFYLIELIKKIYLIACRSACQEHPWRDDRDLWTPEKYSVFADPTLETTEQADQNQEISLPKGGFSQMSIDIERIKQQSNETKLVFVGKGNNDLLIRKYFQNKPGYRLLDASQSFSSKFFFKWVQTTQEIDFFSFIEAKQIVNHISNINIFTSKVGLVNLLKQYEQIKHENIIEINSKQFFPESYQLDMMSDEIEFLNQNTDPSSIWILKPHNSNMGKGIIMIADILTFKKEFIDIKKQQLGQYTTSYYLKNIDSIEEKSDQNLPNNENTLYNFKYDGISHHSIIQKYVKDPLLLNKRKFDIRCYGLIASTQPLVILFNTGYARVCLQEYNLLDIENKENRHCHLTNAAVQKTHKDYKLHKEDSIWTIKKLSSYIEEYYQFGAEMQDKMWVEIKKIIKHVIMAGYPKLEKKRGQYELLGVDILLDSNLKPYLLEINTNPALFVDTESQKQVIPEMMHKVLDIVLALNQTSDNSPQNISLILDKLDLHPFELIYLADQPQQ